MNLKITRPVYSGSTHQDQYDDNGDDEEEEKEVKTKGSAFTGEGVGRGDKKLYL